MRKLIIFFAFILSGASLLSQNGVDLKFNLEKNKTYRLTSASDQTISQTVNGIQQNTSVQASITVSLKMVDASPEFLVAEVRFDTISTHTNAMGVNTIINSASEGNIKSTNMSDIMSCIMNRLSKNALYVKMEYTGRVVELLNSKMLSDIILTDTSLITGQMASVAKTQIKNLVSHNALKTMVESFTYYLPGRQVAKGEKWDILMKTNSSGMSFDITTSYTLNEIQGDKADISAQANIQVSENAQPMEYSGAKITYGEIKGISKSDMVVDTRTGLIVESKAKSHITGDLNVTAPGVTMQIPMEIDSDSKQNALP